MLKLDIPTSYLMRKVPKMGKKRVELKRIQNPSSRHATFSKRKNGLLKKAFELSLLCEAEVALIIFSETGKIHEFASNNDMAEILGKYRIHEESSSTETSSPTSLQNVKYHEAGLEKLQEKLTILQRKEKNLVGEDLESLTMKELQRFEKQLQMSIKKICQRKMIILSQSSKLLVQKIRSLEDEKKKLQTKLGTRGDSSTSAQENASVHQTNQLDLGLSTSLSGPSQLTGDGDSSHLRETEKSVIPDQTTN